MIYSFNNILIDTEIYRLSVAGAEVSVEPQVFNLVVYLIQNKNKVVTREELLDNVWTGRIVSDISINNTIKMARKILGDDGTQQRIIKTIHSRGYQFIAAADIVTQAELPNPNITSKPSTNHKKVTQKIIAVLPFTNAKPDIESDYLSFALASQIIGDLSHLEEFALTPASSISKFANQVNDPITVGRELKAHFIISGNYLVENNAIRLNIEFIEVEFGNLVWRESMQVDCANTFALQDMVAKKVAEGLGVGLRKNQFEQHRDIPNSALAFEYFLRGISYPQSQDGHKMAVEMLSRSIELDPLFAPSYANLGFHRRLLEQHGRVSPTGLKDSEWFYLKALELNPTLIEALANLSCLYTETNRIEEALLITREMLAINPNDANAHFALSYIYRYAGMLDESIEEAEMALTISPDNSRFRSIIAVYISAGRYEDALKNVYLDKGDYGTGYSGMVAFKQGKLDHSKRLFKKVLEIDTHGVWGLIASFYLAYLSNDTKLGLKMLAQLVDTDVVDAENIYYFSEFYALLNEKKTSLDLLDQAVSLGYFNYPNISKNTSFECFRNDTRYRKILSKAKHRHDAFRTKFL